MSKRTDEIVERITDLECRIAEAKQAGNSRHLRVLLVRRSQALAEYAMQAGKTPTDPPAAPPLYWPGIASLIAGFCVASGLIMWWKWH